MNQFAQSVLDAKNKMNILMNPSDEIVALVTNLYNSTPTPTGNANTNVNANQFGMSGGSSTASSIFGGGSTIGNSANNTNGNVNFGSSTTALNPFARNTTNAFGMQQQNQTNLFGNAAQPSTNTVNNPFGSAANNTTGSSLFGGSSFSNSGSSAFAASGQTTTLFGGASAGTGPFSQPAANPFGQTNQMANVFGGAQTQSNPVFGGGATFGSQIKPSTGLFGQANAALSQTGSMFGQTVQNSGFGASTAPTATAQPNFFGNAPQTSSQSIFGGQQTQDNPFAAIAQSGTTNMFGQAQSQMQAATAQPQQQPPPSFQSSTNIFGGSANAFGNSNSQPNVFGVGGGGPFGAQTAAPNLQQQQQQLQPQQQQQQQQHSIFGTNSFSAPAPVAPIQDTSQASNPFGNANVFQSQQLPPQQNPMQQFGGASIAGHAQPNPFAAPAHQQQSAQPASVTLYTPMDSLDPDEIEAFKSDSFDINRLPTKPPPMELCI